MLSFKPTFSPSSFTFIKRLFSSSLLSAITLSAYLRLLIFLPTILIPACASSSPAFQMTYSARKSEVLVPQSCLTLCNPMDYSPPGFSVHRILQARILEWIAFPFSKCKPAAAKSLQLHPTLCDPIDGSPPGSFVPGILQARTLEWVAISFSTREALYFCCLLQLIYNIMKVSSIQHSDSQFLKIILHL